MCCAIWHGSPLAGSTTPWSWRCRPETANPAQMDLSALSELKVTEKGVELKLVDRIRALETLFRLLEQGDNDGAEGLYQALEAVAGALGDEDGE